MPRGVGWGSSHEGWNDAEGGGREKDRDVSGSDEEYHASRMVDEAPTVSNCREVASQRQQLEGVEADEVR